MLADVTTTVRLRSSASTDLLKVDARVLSDEKFYPPRPDGYWTAKVVKPARYGQETSFEVLVDIKGETDALDALYGAWIGVQMLTYGFE